ncbi:MAG: FHA domain-containing protein [Planctomycetota bacterium]
MPKVTIVEGPGSGTVFEIERAAILGRLDTNDIPVQDKKASREHAKIYLQGDKFSVVDLNSSNGTFVNGAQITKKALEDGDEIEIGTVRMRFEHPELAAAKAASGTKRRSLDDDFSTAKGGAAAAAGSKPADIVMKSHAPLQYSRVKPGRSLLGFDLEQISDVGRFLIYAGAVAVFAVLIYLSYTLVSG